MGFLLVSTNDRANVEISLFCIVGSVSREGQGIQDGVCGVFNFFGCACCFDVRCFLPKWNLTSVIRCTLAPRPRMRECFCERWLGEH